MSYILDALKKTEREKARKDRHGGMINVAGELFTEDSPHNRSTTNIIRICIVVVLASLLTFCVTWYLLLGGKEKKVVSKPVASPQAPTPSPTSPADIKSPVPPSLPAAISSPSPATLSTPGATAPQSAQNVPPASAVIEESDEGNTRNRRRSKMVPAMPNSSAPPQVQQQNDSKTPATPAPGDIKVSGIAWQDERSARRAVVNGFLLHEGSIVSGAKITDILQDRVRFSQNGRTFEVSFVSAGLPSNK